MRFNELIKYSASNNVQYLVGTMEVLNTKIMIPVCRAGERRAPGPGPRLTHFQEQAESNVITDSPVAPGPGRQVGEPDTGDPVLVEVRLQALKLFPFFWRHETCREKVGGA